jgi:hypothetical protein
VTSLRARIREFGAAVFLLYAVHRLAAALSGGRLRIVPYALVAQPLGTQALAAVRDDPGTVVRRVEADTAPVAELPRPAAIVAARFAAGHECHIARVKDDFAGTIWIARARYDEDEVRCTYRLADPDTCVWDFDVYVAPAYRLGRTMARLWKAVDATLAAQGMRWTFSRISLFNPASLSSHARLGTVRVGTAVFLCAGGMQLCLSSLAPHVHLSLTRRSAPTLTLRSPPPAG